MSDEQVAGRRVNPAQPFHTDELEERRARQRRQLRVIPAWMLDDAQKHHLPDLDLAGPRHPWPPELGRRSPGRRGGHLRNLGSTDGPGDA